MYWNVTEAKFMFFDRRNIENRLKFTIWTPVNSLPLRMFLKQWTLSIKKDNLSKSCITVKRAQRTQKVEIYLEFEGSHFTFFSTVLGHYFGGNVGKEFGVMLIGKGPHKPESLRNCPHTLFYDIHGPDWGQYRWRNWGPLLHSFVFISKLKAGDPLTTREYMNYQTFSNLQLKLLLKNSFHSIHIQPRDRKTRTVKNYP